jgi:HTH-type transcriptional regulator/antitoxin HipB
MTEEHDIEFPHHYYSVTMPKLEIVKAIKNELEQQSLSIRKLGEQIGMKHPQIIRVTSGENYNIETLLRLLDGLNLEIEIKKKSK